MVPSNVIICDTCLRFDFDFEFLKINSTVLPTYNNQDKFCKVYLMSEEEDSTEDS
jgi:hypothetical protein